MEIHDLRSFLQVLQEKDLLFTAGKEVDWNHEIGSIIGTLEPSGKAAYFPKVKGKEFAVCGGMLASMDAAAAALGCEKAEITDFLAKCLENPIKPKVVEKAPCQENVLTGDQIDMDRVPVPVHAPKDGGPIITGGVIVSKPVDGTRQNLSFQRMHVKGKDKISIMINEWRHLKDFYNEAEAQGKALPISIVIGADPVVYIAAGLRYDGDEMEIAGAVRGRPMEVVKCVTNDIYVPAEAEFVIEAEILPTQRELEGPLGEFTGHYSEPWNSPVMHVTAITHRNGAIYQTINGASFEHINLGNVLPREPLLKNFATYVSSGVVNVHIPPYGSGFLALVQIKKKNPGEPKNVALAAMMTYVNIKNVIVVDEDVDIYNPADVMWALSNRVIPEKDIFYVPNAQGHELDPCSDERGVQTKMGIDATLSDESRVLERVRYPKVNLQDYL
ncbi:MAG: UbiD family decarboxylase [Oscillospiraceae bacterium]|nr:UbiD family decarboxylase [Oscillospiraceae bacterium]MCI9474041.1 UbiD family decarboxylase [Flavonifractor sp.]